MQATLNVDAFGIFGIGSSRVEVPSKGMSKILEISFTLLSMTTVS